MPKNKQTVRSKGRRWRFLLPLLVVLALLVVLGPTILGTAAVCNRALAQAVPAQIGTLTAESGSFGWTGTTALHKVRFVDPAGEQILYVERIEVGASLPQLALGTQGPLAAHLVNPVVNVAFDAQGSNLGKILDAVDAQRKRLPPQPAAAAPPSAARPLAITLTNGQVRVSDQTTRRRWEVLVSAAKADLPDTKGYDLLDRGTLSLTGAVHEVADDGSRSPTPGRFSAELVTTQDGRRQLRGQLGSVPAAILTPLLKRNDPQAFASGWLSGEGEAVWAIWQGEGPPPADLLADVIARNATTQGKLALTDGEYRGRLMGGQPLRLRSVELPWQLDAVRGGLLIRRFEAKSDMGAARITGSASPQEIATWARGTIAPPADLHVDADVDLVKLAAVAPELLRLRQGVELDSGHVRGSLDSDTANGLPRLVGEVKTDRLAGRLQGRRITWDKPLKLLFTASRPADVWQLASLRCESEFLTATAEGGATNLQGEATFDLDRLASELRQFLDLGDWRLAGQGTAKGTFQQSPDGQAWQLLTSGQVDRLQVGTREQPLAQEPQLRFEADLRGINRETTPRAGRVVLQAEDDSLTLSVSDPKKALPTPQKRVPRARPIEVRLVGDLARWHRRAGLLAPTLPPSETLSLGGQIEVTAQGDLTDERIQLTPCKVRINNLAIDSGRALHVREEQVEASGDCAWHFGPGILLSESGQFATSAVSFSTRGVQIAPNKPTDSRGELVFLGDLRQLHKWVVQDASAEGWQAEGVIRGRASLAAENQGLRILSTATGERLALFQTTPQGKRPVWSEPQLEANLQAVLSTNPNGTLALQVDALKLKSQMLKASAQGRIDDLAVGDQVDLSGRVDYDLERLTPLLWPRMGDSLRLVGKDQARFQVTSRPLQPGAVAQDGVERLEARVEAPWESANLFGLPVGPGRLGATLSDGLVRFDPLDVTVGQGRLTAQPTVALTPPPASVSLTAGPLVHGVAFSTEVSERVLKFIAPVLADATRIEGHFSVALTELAMPLDGSPTGRASGVLTIHSTRVMPGPSVAEWVALVQQIRGVVRDGVEGVAGGGGSPLMTITDQNVEFQMVEGRVYHRGLRFNVGDAIVTSEGSVGLDETLDLLLTVPILEAWVAQRPTLLGGLRGQSVRIPVRGTFSEPRIDKEAFRQLSKQLLQSAAQGAIEGGLDLLFKRLQSR